jgi:hypothetical protein
VHYLLSFAISEREVIVLFVLINVPVLNFSFLLFQKQMLVWNLLKIPKKGLCLPAEKLSVFVGRKIGKQSYHQHLGSCMHEGLWICVVERILLDSLTRYDMCCLGPW